MSEQYHYALKIEFEETLYADVLLLLEKLGINSFEEGECITNANGEIEIVNEYTLITLRAEDQNKLNEIESKLKNEISTLKFTDLGKGFNYLDEWKKFSKPIQITPSLTICPSWISEEQKPNTIVLDPGYAFGSGSHETTILCAKEIENIKITDSLLDVGCGSGILSLIAAKLGLIEIKGIDIDPHAVIAARENALKNSIDTIKFSNEKLENLNTKYDVVVANILSSVLLELKKDLLKAVKPGGTLILSGILKTEVDTIVQAFKFKSFYSTHLGSWALIKAQL